MYWDIWRWAYKWTLNMIKHWVGGGQRQKQHTSCCPNICNSSERSGSNTHWANQSSRDSNWAWVSGIHWGWTQVQEHSRSVKGDSIPQPSSKLAKDSAGPCLPHSPVACLAVKSSLSWCWKDWKKTLHPKWSVLIAAKPTRENRAMDTQTHLCLLTPSPLIPAW